MNTHIPLRVLMISDVFFPRINGVSTSIQTFNNDLRAENVEVRLVAPDYPGTTLDPDSDITRIPSSRIPFDPEDRLMHWNRLVEATNAIAREGIDLIHIQTPFAAHYAGIMQARKHRVPVLATYHTHFEEYIAHYLPGLPRSILRAGARFIAKSQCNGLDAVIVPSNAMHETLTEYGVKVPLHVLPTGIPIAHFDHGNGERFRERFGIPPNRPVALFVGRVAHEKSIEFLINAIEYALPTAPDLLLVIAGEGPALAPLMNMVNMRKLENHVQFVGYLNRDNELPDCYAAADVFVFASRTETQGLVLLEAMAAGLPIYAIAEMGTRDILEPQCGAVIAPTDIPSFGLGLAKLVRDQNLLGSMSVEARRYANSWSSGARAKKLALLYRQLASGFTHEGLLATPPGVSQNALG